MVTVNLERKSPDCFKLGLETCAKSGAIYGRVGRLGYRFRDFALTERPVLGKSRLLLMSGLRPLFFGSAFA